METATVTVDGLVRLEGGGVVFNLTAGGRTEMYSAAPGTVLAAQLLPLLDEDGGERETPLPPWRTLTEGMPPEIVLTAGWAPDRAFRGVLIGKTPHVDQEQLRAIADAHTDWIASLGDSAARLGLKQIQLYCAVDRRRVRYEPWAGLHGWRLVTRLGEDYTNVPPRPDGYVRVPDVGLTFEVLGG